MVHESTKGTKKLHGMIFLTVAIIATVAFV